MLEDIDDDCSRDYTVEIALCNGGDGVLEDMCA